MLLHVSVCADASVCVQLCVCRGPASYEELIFNYMMEYLRSEADGDVKPPACSGGTRHGQFSFRNETAERRSRLWGQCIIEGWSRVILQM